MCLSPSWLLRYCNIPEREPLVASVLGAELSGIISVGASVLMLGSGILVSGTGIVIVVVGIIVPAVGAVVELVGVVALVSVGSVPKVSLLQAQAHRESATTRPKAKMQIFFISVLLFSDFNSSISFACMLRQEKCVIPVKILSISH